MRHCVAALGVCALMTAATAQAAGCGQILRLHVEPPEKADAVAGALQRRLEAAGAPGLVERDGAGLRAVLPEGASESLMTRPGRVEFRLAAAADDAPGALSLPRAQGGRESVSPEIIVDESHLRAFSLREAGDRAVIAFRFDPHAMKNLMAATSEAIGRKLAIIVDDVVVADPIVRAPVASTSGEIDPQLSADSARELVDLLRSGRLPARVSVAAREAAPCKTP